MVHGAILVGTRTSERDVSNVLLRTRGVLRDASRLTLDFSNLLLIILFTVLLVLQVCETEALNGRTYENFILLHVQQQ